MYFNSESVFYPNPVTKLTRQDDMPCLLHGMKYYSLPYSCILQPEKL